MTTEIALRYGGVIGLDAVTEGWRLTCADDDGEITVVHLTQREAAHLVALIHPTGGAS